MSLVARTGETIARNTTRKGFLQRATGAVFAFASASAVGGVFAGTAQANICEATDTSCSCNPYGPCPKLADCSGGNCVTTYCTYYKTPWSSTGCWCTKTCSYNCGRLGAYIGYYKCCDCKCSGTVCTCQGFVYTCRTTAADAILCC